MMPNRRVSFLQNFYQCPACFRQLNKCLACKNVYLKNDYCTQLYNSTKFKKYSTFVYKDWQTIDTRLSNN